MAITPRYQRRIENHERALAAYLEHHAAAVAHVGRIHEAIENHDLAPDPEAITWAPSARWRRPAGTSRP